MLNDGYIVLSQTMAWECTYVLLKALPPVCMKYTAQGESQVKRSAIFVTRPSPRAEYFHTNKVAVL